MNKAFGSIVSGAVASLMASSMTFAEEAPKKEAAAAKTEMACQNNTCKGHASCKGFGNASCGGQNSCKGIGSLNKSDEASCKKAKGKWVAKTK